MVNKVILVGRLGKDPELKYSQNGMAICRFSLATDASYLDNQGNKVEKIEWHTIVIFNKQAENATKYLSKGSLVYVEGKLATRKWQDQQGNDRYTTEILANILKFLSSNNKDEQKTKTTQKSTKKAPEQEDFPCPPPSEMDDCPF